MLSYILLTALVGILASLSMLVFFEMCTRFNICRVDVIKGLGSFFTQSEKNAYLWGALLNISLGIVFSFCYVFIFKILPLPSGADGYSLYPIVGVGIGFNHGMIAALVLSMMFPPYHPIEKFRKAGLEIAIFFALAHILYGCVVGVLFKTFQV